MVLLAYRERHTRIKSVPGISHSIQHEISYSAEGQLFYRTFIGMDEVYVTGDAERPSLFSHHPNVRPTWMFGVEPWAVIDPTLPNKLEARFDSLGLPRTVVKEAVEKMMDPDNWYVYARSRETTIRETLIPSHFIDFHVLEQTPSYDQRVAGLKQKIRLTLDFAPIVGGFLMLAESYSGRSIFGDDLTENERVLLGIGVLLNVIGWTVTHWAHNAWRSRITVNHFRDRFGLDEKQANVLVDAVRRLNQEDIDVLKRLLRGAKVRKFSAAAEKEWVKRITEKIRVVELEQKLFEVFPPVEIKKAVLREWAIFYRNKAFGRDPFSVGPRHPGLQQFYEDLYDLLVARRHDMSWSAPKGWKYCYNIKKTPEGYRVSTFLSKEEVDWTGWETHRIYPTDAVGRNLSLETARDIAREMFEWKKSKGFVVDYKEILVPENIGKDLFEGFPEFEAFMQVGKRGEYGGSFE